MVLRVSVYTRSESTRSLRLDGWRLPLAEFVESLEQCRSFGKSSFSTTSTYEAAPVSLAVDAAVLAGPTRIKSMWCGTPVIPCDIVRGLVWCGLVWSGVVRRGVLWWGAVWCGVVWCGVEWCAAVWCGVVWCGVV